MLDCSIIYDSTEYLILNSENLLICDECGYTQNYFKIYGGKDWNLIDAQKVR